MKKAFNRGIGALRVLVAFGVAVYAITLYLDRSLGTHNILLILKQAPSVLTSGKRLSQNPLVNKSYWENQYVDGNTATLPYPHYWPVDEMLDAVAGAMKSASLPRVRLAHLLNYEWMSGDFLTYKIWQHRLNNNVSMALPLPPPPDKPLNEFLGNYHFLITKSGQIFKSNFYGLPWSDESQAFVEKLLADDGRLLGENGFRPLRHFSLPDGSTGILWISGTVGKVLSLLDLLGLARITAPDGYVDKGSFMMNGKAREVLFQHPCSGSGVSAVRWPGLKIPAGASLEFGIALDPKVWSPEKGDGVEFSIDVEKNGIREKVFAKYLDPKNKESDRQWFDYRVDLTRYGGSEVDVILSTSSGPRGDHNFDHAGWSNLIIRGK